MYKYDPRFDPGSGAPPYLSASAPLVKSEKEMFTIDTLICSTKLTQKPALLNLLKWRSTQDDAQRVQMVVRHITFVVGEEVVKFLTDIFDAVFAILD